MSNSNNKEPQKHQKILLVFSVGVVLLVGMAYVSTVFFFMLFLECDTQFVFKVLYSLGCASVIVYCSNTA